MAMRARTTRHLVASIILVHILHQVGGRNGEKYQLAKITFCNA